jgi:hypothetical protein
VPQIFCGEFPNGKRELQVPLTTSISNIEILCSQTRTICESIYYVLLLGYQTGLKTFYNRSNERSKANGEGRRSTTKWLNALSLSKEATRTALLAHSQWEGKEFDLSNGSAKKAVELIAKRGMSCCALQYLTSLTESQSVEDAPREKQISCFI